MNLSTKEINEYIYDGDDTVTDYLKNSNKVLSLRDVLRKEQEDALADIDMLKYQIGKGGKSYANKVNGDELPSDISVIDKDWIKSRFMVPNSDLSIVDVQNRYLPTNGWKFSTTQLGAHMAINPRPQYTRYADIKTFDRLQISRKTRLYNEVSTGFLTDIGMGRYYSEAIDDNATVIFMEFGVPKFNSLLSFFTKAVTYEDSYIANHGRLPVGYKGGKDIGNVLAFVAFPIRTLIIWAVKFAVGFLFGGNYSYYYMTPTMHTYWGAVNNIVTQLATELGILAPMLMSDKSDAKKIGVPVKINDEDVDEMIKYLPHIFSRVTNYIDVFEISTRYQQRAHKLALEEYRTFNKANATDMTGYVSTFESKAREYMPGEPTFFNVIDKTLTFTGLLKNLTTGKGMYAKRVEVNNIDPTSKTEEKKDTKLEATKDAADDKFTRDPGTGLFAAPEVKTLGDKFEQMYTEWAEAFDSTVRDGNMFAILHVDYQGSTSDSISNSYGEISTGGLIKSASTAGRDVRFSLSGGNIIGGGVDKALDLLKNVVMGTLDSVTYGLSNVITTILGGAYTSIPKRWEDSDISLASVTYTMSLVSPYGNTISRLQNLYLPLAMILAGALPLAAGKSSYTSPFLCRLFNKGVQDIKLGMITSLSITRGITNLGYTTDRHPLSFEVSFTVTDFAPFVAAPISASMFDNFNLSLEDDTPIGTYLSTLASRDVYANKYMLPRFKLKFSRILMGASQSVSPAAWGMRIGGWAQKFLGPVVAVPGGLQSNSQTVKNY